jgi:hypothetical protein
MMFLWGMVAGLYLASPLILLFKWLDYRKDVRERLHWQMSTKGYTK